MKLPFCYPSVLVSVKTMNKDKNQYFTCEGVNLYVF